MFRLRLLIVPALVLALAATASAKGNKGNKGKNVKHAVRGTVQSISGDSVTVSVRKPKKQGGGTTEQTFPLDSSTHFELVKLKPHAKGEKAEPEILPATASDVKTGTSVQVVEGNPAASKVSILQGGHHGKKKNKKAPAE